jgi:hypothetical protein
MLPDPISIEAALHWAVHRDFDTHALGGPIDIFGMGRSTMLSSNPDGWQMAAGLRIDQADLLCVLPAHTNGLLWELEQIVEAGARERVLFVLPPDGDASAKLPHPTTRLLGDLGFDLPAEFGPGCAMCAPDGTVDMKLQFGALWDGTLRRALLARVDGRGTELGEP